MCMCIGSKKGSHQIFLCNHFFEITYGFTLLRIFLMVDGGMDFQKKMVNAWMSQ